MQRLRLRVILFEILVCSSYITSFQFVSIYDKTSDFQSNKNSFIFRYLGGVLSYHKSQTKYEIEIKLHYWPIFTWSIQLLILLLFLCAVTESKLMWIFFSVDLDSAVKIFLFVKISEVNVPFNIIRISLIPIIDLSSENLMVRGNINPVIPSASFLYSQKNTTKN